MVFHLPSHSQRNMFRQATWLFPLQSNRFSFLGNPVSHQLILLFFAIVKGQPFAVMLSSGFLREYVLQFKGQW